MGNVLAINQGHLSRCHHGWLHLTVREIEREWDVEVLPSADKEAG
jgi:hypothetical protein